VKAPLIFFSTLSQRYTTIEALLEAEVTAKLGREDEQRFCRMILFFVHLMAPPPVVFLAPGSVSSTDPCFQCCRSGPVTSILCTALLSSLRHEEPHFQPVSHPFPRGGDERMYPKI